MYFRFRRLHRVSQVFPRIYPAAFYQSSTTGIDVLTDGGGAAASLCKGFGLAGLHWQRYSTRSRRKDKAVNTLSFIRSLLHQPRGPSHFWLNTAPGRENMIKGDGVFLVVVVRYNGGSFEANQNTTKMIEKAKSLQQRYPHLQVIALQLCPSVCLDDISSHLWKITKDYITFPILLSNKNIPEETNVPCFLLSKGFQNPTMYPGKDVDLMVLHKAINDFNADISKDTNVVDVKSTWNKPIEVFKEPDVCSASRNLLFSFPACISADAGGNRLFLSDVNHHRIIVLNSNGNILDAIGSSPGFEDGEFEMAKLMRPAASFYDSSEDCLYFVDSENHAIRRADMEARVVETVFPVSGGSQKKGLWEWIVDKIWSKRSIKMKSEEYDPASLLFPWHLLKSSENDIFVLNQSFGTLWIVDLKSGLIRDVIEESSKILEICGQMILEKCEPLQQLPAHWLKQQVDTNCSLEEIQYGGLMSSVTSYQDDVVFYDEVGQRVVKFNEGSGSATPLSLSNFENLGLPYWLTSSIEKIYSVDSQPEVDLDHSECFRLLPGRVDIELIVDIPEYADLIEQPQQGCIWCQARGAASEISRVERQTVPSQKVSATQKFYDDLDSLIFTTPGEESATEAESQPSGEELQEGRVRIGCTINTSPGTSEAVIYAALYLRLKKNLNSQGDSQEIKAVKIADILEPKRKSSRDMLIKLLMMSERELEDVVFMRPLNVRLKFNCDLHPKGEHSKEIVVTDSTVEARVTLK
ncbi:uncharacterized protein LOC125211714 isoform X1 [Salvia hispanica]|uniref:uncharacterized protein LOC125211714 isoform X1 n=2 Tax=Salvia hispanica TaxID=49212 RepID=UPI0020093BB1|nr:uncharacterized protein LOC125211714 isoform X1 [Salvia hispanica]XP_047967577.1 uncharacterized protein LOC125211714 isoform X1 [Salvia hispanica]